MVMHSPSYIQQYASKKLYEAISAIRRRNVYQLAIFKLVMYLSGKQGLLKSTCNMIMYCLLQIGHHYNGCSMTHCSYEHQNMERDLIMLMIVSHAFCIHIQMFCFDNIVDFASLQS